LIRESQSASIEALRAATLRLTCLAGNAGLPAVSMPLGTAGGLPAGACFVAGVDRDRDLIDLAHVISAEAIFT
ncbi:MAG: glutamyl-tRNA amidotransferase, partial [Nocardioidaceae bacterium]|nr:glutamyl-tRNA amidotransferase [Nocardioidaceae bacterium]